MYVVLDANVVGIRAPLSGNALQLLIDAHTRSQLKLVVPELVVREVSNKWLEKTVAEQEKVAKSARELAKFDIKVAYPTESALVQQAHRMQEAFRARLRELAIDVVSYPEVGHQTVVDRALRRRQPFDDRGHNGYRDALLWENVKELAHDDDVVLISQDKGAFADSDWTLASELAAEVEDLPGRVELLNDPGEMSERVSEQDGRALERVRYLVRERSFRVLLEERLEDALDGFDPGAALGQDLDVGAHVLFARVLGPDQIGAVEPIRAYLSSDESALVDLTVWLTGTIHFEVDIGDAGFVEESTGLLPASGMSAWSFSSRREETAPFEMYGWLRTTAEAAIEVDPGRITRHGWHARDSGVGSNL